MGRFLVILALVFSLLGAQTAAADLVTNGGFETEPDFTGWTCSGKPADYYTYTTSYNVHSGKYTVQSGPSTLFFLSQTLPTIAGQSYNITLWLANDNGGSEPNNTFTVDWGGSIIYALNNIPDQAYTKYQFTVNATGASTVLTLGLQNSWYFYLDDVSVNAVNAVPRAVPIPAIVLLLCEE